MDQKGQSSERKIREEAPGVWLGPFFIEPSYVTRSELVERKLSKSEKKL